MMSEAPFQTAEFPHPSMPGNASSFSVRASVKGTKVLLHLFFFSLTTIFIAIGSACGILKGFKHEVRNPCPCVHI